MGSVRMLLLAGGMALFAGNAVGMSVMEVAGKCGDDSKIYCADVGYGDAMTQCLAKHYAKLKPDCKTVIDRIKGGEKVSLF